MPRNRIAMYRIEEVLRLRHEAGRSQSGVDLSWLVQEPCCRIRPEPANSTPRSPPAQVAPVLHICRAAALP